jgi:glyoxylase-like metal-dependent hydrolase (beta-lactamase superfamily II)
LSPPLRELGNLEQMLKLGDFEIYSFVENSFLIDGGAMFGVVPKVIWEKLVSPDEFNRVVLDLNLILVKSKLGNVLIDCGIGDTLSERQRKIYGLSENSSLQKNLLSFGLRPEDIDFVILSHLHLDHAGGLVKFDEKKEKVPTFPKAKHIVQEKEFEDAIHPDERTSATYLPENFLLLERYNLLELVDGEKEVVPGIKVIPTGGHSRGHQAILLESQKERLLCPGDIIPTQFHLKVPYVASVDIFPLDTMRVKKEFINQCIDQGWFLAFDHDLFIKVAKLEKNEDKIELVKVSIYANAP